MHVDKQFLDAGILPKEVVNIYASIADEDVFGMLAPILSLSEKTMPSLMLKKYFSSYIKSGGNFLRWRVDDFQTSNLKLMLEIKDEDDNSALLAYLTRDIINREFKSVGVSLDLLVVEQSDDMYFPDIMPRSDAESK